MMRKYFVILALVACLSVPVQAGLSKIGVHFPSDRDNARLQPNELAGVFPQANWNSADGGADPLANHAGNTSNISLPNSAVLTDDSGATTGVTVDWVSNGTWNTVNGTATPDAKLMNGYIDAYANGNLPGQAEAVTVSFTGIPYDSYDAIVYVGADGNGRTGQVSDGTTTYHYLTLSNDPDGSGGFDPSDFILADATDPLNRADGNYAVFTGLTGSTLQLDIVDWTSGNNNGIHGVQIIQVPEPATLMLLGFGGLAMLRRKRN